MAFRRETENLLSGGLDLSFPADNTPVPLASQIKNFSTANQGNLVSRSGSSVALTTPGSVQFILNKNYQLAGGQLSRAGAGVGDAGGSTQICATAKHAWVPGSRKKDDGSNFRDWGVKAPTVPLVAMASPEAGKVYTTWSDAVADPSATVNQTGQGPEGQAAQIDLSVNTGYAISSASASGDFSSFHQYDLDRLWILLKRPTDIDSLTLQVDVNSGDFTTDYFTADIPRKQFRRANGWNQIHVRRTQLSGSDPTPNYTRVGNTVGKGWNTVAGVRILISVNNNSTITRIKLSTWDVVGGLVSTNAKGKGAGLIEGDDIRWFWTYVTDDEMGESNPSPVSNMLSIKRQAAQLTGLVPSTQDGVTKANIYRTGGTLGAVYLVNSRPIPIGDYHDDNGDDILTQSIATIMATDNDLPPAGGLIAVEFLGRVLVFKGARMYWSKVHRPDMFNGPDIGDGAWADIGDPADPVQHVTTGPQVCTIYKKSSIYVQYGDPDASGGSAVVDAQAGFGIPGPNCAIQAGGSDYIISVNGVFRVSQGSAVEISQRIQKLFHGETVTLPSGDTIQPFSSGDLMNAAIGWSGDRVFISVGTQALVYNIARSEWFQDSRQFTAFGYDGGMLAGRSNGEIWQIDTGTTDNGQAIPVVWEKTISANLPDTPKTWNDTAILIDTQGQNLTLQAFYDLGKGGSVGLGSIVTNGETRLTFQHNGNKGIKAKHLTLKLSGLLTSQVDIRGFWQPWYAEERQARTFDGDETDFGTSIAKEIRRVWVDMDNPGPVGFELQTDQPGFALATRDIGHTFGAAAERREDLYVFPQDYIAHDARFLLNGVDFMCFGLRALIQLVPGLIHGSKGDFFDSDAIDFGVEWVKLFKFIEVVYAGTSTAFLRFYTDLPGGDLHECPNSPFALEATGGIITRNMETALIALTDNVKGRLCEVRIEPIGDFRLEFVKLYGKIVGAPQSSAWNWFPIPTQPSEPAVWKDVYIAPDAIDA